MDHSVWDRRCGDTGEESEGWITDSVWDRRFCGDTGEESEGWITVCGTGVVVLLVKREGGGSQCVGQALWCYW